MRTFQKWFAVVFVAILGYAYVDFIFDCLDRGALACVLAVVAVVALIKTGSDLAAIYKDKDQPSRVSVGVDLIGAIGVCGYGTFVGYKSGETLLPTIMLVITLAGLALIGYYLYRKKRE